MNPVLGQIGGAILVMIGVATSVVGLHGIKYTTRRREAQEGVCASDPARRRAKRVLYAWSALWVAGQVVQLSASAFATDSVVACCTNVGIWINAAFAYRLVGEPFTRYDAMATVGITAGAVLVVVYAPLLETTRMDSRQTAHLWTASYLPIAGVLATAGVAAAPLALHVGLTLRRRPSATAGAAAYGVGAGFFGGTSVTFAKLCFLMFAETLRDGGENAFVQPVGFLWASLAFLGELALVYCLFVGVARHEAAVVVPAYYSLMTVTASVQGLTLFDLLRKFASAGAAAAFGVGVALCVGSMLLISVSRSCDHRVPTTDLSAPLVAPDDARSHTRDAS
jgi:hypothetical protein